MSAESPLLNAPENCWRIEPADRLAFLIDGEAYFRALREAMVGARHSIFILGWDIDTRIHLARGDNTDDLPDTLGDLLFSLVKRNGDLHVRVLSWDWAVLYAAERQWLPLYKLDWHRHRRLHLQLDDDCPFGASQHQKVVVIDGNLAFAGGFDLSRDRWDTADHSPGNPLRINPEGEPYPPFHDVQVMVSGAAAVALDELARERWRRCTGEVLQAPATTARPPWPDGVAADMEKAEVAVARTECAHKGRAAVREVERLFLDTIAAARKTLYFENQYLSSTVIGEALADRLEEPDGPEVIMVLPLKTGGWLEQHTMDVLRSRLLRRLREADRHDRLRIFYPHRDDLGDEHISVHAKLMVADDTLARVGSANLSNRSMGLDSECDLAIEATSADERRAVAALRDRLLAEHLGCDPETVARRIAEEGSVIAAVDRLRGGRRSLEDLAGAVPDLADELLPGHDVVDPESPMSAEELAERLIPEEERQSVARQLAPAVMVVLALVILAAAWRWTPLGEMLEVDTLVGTIRTAGESFTGTLLLLAAFLVGGVIAVPLTLMVIVTVLVLGPWLGLAVSLAGGVISAMASFWIGSAVGRKPLRRIAGGRLNKLSRRLARRGVIAIITLRIVPVAPFTVINMVAGASHIRLRDFALGTLVGLLPGLIAIALFTDRVAATVQEPELPEFAILATVVGAIAVGGWVIRNTLVRRKLRRAEAEAET